jgi:chemotaxis protein MotB
VTLLLRLRELSDLDETRVTVEGHADTRPLAPNDSVLNRARNRRVEVILVHGEVAERALSVEQLLAPEEPADG